MKKMIALLLSITMMLAFIGCTTAPAAEPAAPAAEPAASADEPQAAPSEDKKVVIGIAMDSMEDFNVYIMNGFNAFAEANKDKLEILVSDADYDSAAQISSVENFVSNQVDAIIIKAVDSEGCGTISDCCKEAGIPLVVVNTPITSTYDCLVGSDNVNCGIIQGEYAAELLGNKGNVAILYGDPGHDGSRSRTEGVESVVAKNPDMQVVSTQTGNWSRDEGMKIAENWIQSGMEIDAILSNNDEMAIGAMLAYEDAGKTMTILGVDALPEACALIEEGRLTGSVFQDGYTQAYTAMDAAMKLANAETVENYIEVPFELVIKENAAEYAAKYK